MDLRKVIVLTVMGTVVCSSVFGQKSTDSTAVSKNLDLKEVVVKGRSVINKGDYQIVVPKTKDVEHSSRGIDLLSMQILPGLSVDRALNKITVDGGTPVFQINGKEVKQERFNNVNPAKIKRIEYSNSPGVRYLDRGATGIINIIMKNEDDGGSVYVDASSDVELMMTDAYMNGSYHKGKSEFTLEYGFNRRHYRNGPSEDNDKYIAPERVVERNMTMDSPVHYTIHRINGEYTFQPNDSTMFIAGLRNQIAQNGNIGYGKMAITDRGVASNVDIINDFGLHQWAPTLDLFYSQKLPKGQKLELNVVGEYSNSDSYRVRTYNYPTYIDEYPAHIDNHGWALSAEAVYSKQFKTVGTRWGVQYQHNFAQNDYKDQNEVSKMYKDNTYIFGQANGKIGEKVNWTLGTGAKIFAVKDGDKSKTYVRNLSTAQLNWRISDFWSMTGEIRYSPALPSLSDLSPVLMRTDAIEGNQGNPELRPAHSLNNSIRVMYADKNGWFVNLQGGYNHYFNDVVSAYHYDSALDLFISTPQNADYYNNLYARADVGVKNLFNHFNISFNGEMVHQQVKGTGFHHTNDNFSLTMNAQAMWGGFLIGAYYNLCPEWLLNGENLYQSERGQNIYAQYKWKNFTAKLNWHCPFNNDGYEYKTKHLSAINPGNHVNCTVDNGNMVVLGFSWNLNFGKKFNKGQKTLYNGGYDAGTVR